MNTTAAELQGHTGHTPYVGTAWLRDGLVFAPYDVRKEQVQGDAFVSIRTLIPNCHHLDFSPSLIDYSKTKVLHILGGFSQGMGDAIMGVGLLQYIKAHFGCRIRVFLANTMPSFVYEIYALAVQERILDAIELLPAQADHIAANDATVVDLTDLFGHRFRDGAIVDMYATALGLDASQIPVEYKKPTWLKKLRFASADQPYSLLVSDSKEDFKSMPDAVAVRAARTISLRHALPVHGFTNRIAHDTFLNISATSTSARDFIRIIANAAHVYTVDTAAMHIAAGLGVPTTAFVVTDYWSSWCHYYLNEPAFQVHTVTGGAEDEWVTAVAKIENRLN
ncbi:glycosyltransferase family 9 protein [Andreprevotia chitinilytica]|uniref:glycosyltransferase family 9 protein n=1 Tax=Andreprevotia chitinilytica TaxID=396808 RepID=UPI0012EBC9E2|nr:hypothetical protein [Andreprevotia chitinilytica]